MLRWSLSIASLWLTEATMHQKGENHYEMSIKTRVLHDNFWHLSVYSPNW
jgi:hypothetical protein